MSTPGLTEDQARLLLRHAGSWLVAAMISDPDYGISSLKSRAGGSAWPEGTNPELPYNMTGTLPTGIHGYTCDRATWAQTTVVALSYNEIRRWAKELPEQTVAKVKLMFRGMADERNRTINWCCCPYQDVGPNEFTGPCRRYHPTAAERDERHAREDALSTREDYLARKALGLLDSAPKQLELFA